MSNSKLDSKKLTTTIHKIWDESIVPTLMDYIKIPNKSPAYDPLWQEHGYMEQAVTLMVNWCKQHPVKNMQLEVLRLPGRTPVILIEVPGEAENTVLLYGHLDKQPEMAGWDADLDPWKPVLKGDKLYGRGGADDGYAIFSAMTAIKALQEQNLPHARCVILIEACEESGSFDLPYYVDAARGRIGEPELIICLDSGCGNYEQMWITTSLRGLISADLRVDVLSTGIHSGYASGIVPSSFRIIRQLLNRIEDEKTGKIL
jgi:acetylornithine deacetylase/succinyl-diaminopimelate desuccinylase-like protein